MHNDRPRPKRRSLFVIVFIIAERMRDIWTQQRQVARLEISNMVSDKTLPGAFCNEHQFKFRMIMPGCGVIAVIEIFNDERLVLFTRQMFKCGLHSKEDILMV